MNYQNSLEFARSLDAQDPLKDFRKRFFIPQHEGKDCVYFIGNSLGLQPRTVSKYIQQELDDWAQLGVEGHFQAKNPWMPYHEIFSQQLSKIIGCRPYEVVVMNSLTVNLHLLMVSFYRPGKERYKIICEAKAFPSDQYAFESQARYHAGLSGGSHFNPDEAIVEVNPRSGEHIIRTEDILSAIRKHGDETALVLFSGINYYTGQYFDIKSIVDAAHEVGAFAGFDLAHAAGNVQLKMHDWNADFASWCSYKYLNSGPGGVSGVYIHEKHVIDTSIPRFAGWWGYDKKTRFQMEKGFKPIPTAEGWQISNAPILSMAAHKASLDIFEEAGMESLSLKGSKLSNYLLFIIDDINSRRDEKIIEVITPRDNVQKGCQVSMLVVKQGRQIFEALMKQGVMVDWREPNVIRVAAVPLYNSFEDIWRFGEIVDKLMG